jgi:hypothetical protein
VFEKTLITDPSTRLNRNRSKYQGHVTLLLRIPRCLLSRLTTDLLCPSLEISFRQRTSSDWSCKETNPDSVKQKENSSFCFREEILLGKKSLSTVRHFVHTTHTITNLVQREVITVMGGVFRGVR